MNKVKREGYHILPAQIMKERDKQVIRLFDLGMRCQAISLVIGKSYETTRSILRRAKRMGDLTTSPSGEYNRARPAGVQSCETGSIGIYKGEGCRASKDMPKAEEWAG